MLVVQVRFKDAEKIKQYVLQHDLWDKHHVVTKDAEYLYFPVKRRFRCTVITVYRFINKQLATVPDKASSLRDLLKKKLSHGEFTKLKTAFDIVGSIAILEIDHVLEKKEKLIAHAVLQINSHLKTVVKKVGGHEGEFRLQRYKVLAGKRTKETVHKENGVALKLNIEKVYFSPRLAHERLRIARLVQPREKVLVMFSGCAPYPCVIAKNAKPKEIYAVEKNPVGHQYAQENIQLNKLSQVHVSCGDARTIVPHLGIVFDRIIMPLPKGAEAFLDVVFPVVKKGTVIHYYDFVLEGEEDTITKTIDAIFRQYTVAYKILQIVHCGQSKPHELRVCVDIQIK